MQGIALLVLLLVAPSLAEARRSCRFGPGDRPATTRPRDPHGSAIPIDTILVLMQENRSFDHYVGRLHDQGQPGAEGEPADAANRDPTGGPRIRAFHQTQYCEVADLDHSWTGTHREWNHGRMNGFTAANRDPLDPRGSRTMGFYDQSDLPFYYALYATFAIADRYFCSVLSQTFPNRFYLLAGTSFGRIRNDLPTGGTNDFSPPGGTIFERLDDAGVSWRVYYSQFGFASLFSYVRTQRRANVVPIAQYFTDAQAGMLPQVAFVDPIFLGTRTVENDEHPPANIQVGQEFVARVIRALLASPQWPHAALFLTYDEHGGFYDHVRPPRACVPDTIAPMRQPGDVRARFDRYGIRVPLAVVSPYARAHYVSHTVYDHTSIVRFIATRFDLPALTRRDANADPMLELFDFATPAFVTPPTLPAAPIDPARLAECAAP